MAKNTPENKKENEIWLPSKVTNHKPGESPEDQLIRTVFDPTTWADPEEQEAVWKMLEEERGAQAILEDMKKTGEYYRIKNLHANQEEKRKQEEEKRKSTKRKK